MSVLTQISAALDPAKLLEQAGFEPDEWQADVLRSDAKRTLLLCCRQSGKSTVAAAMAVHTATTKPGALVLLLSPSLRQSGELFRNVSAIYRQTARQGVPMTADSALRMELANGSRLVALPAGEETIRGFSGVDLLIIDEASRVPDNLYRAVRPFLAVSNGRLIALTTPFGRRGWFHREWGEGQGWNRIKVTASQCPRISREFLEQERVSLGEWWFKQEYLCEFTDTDQSIFSYDLVHQALDDGVKPLFALSSETRALLEQPDAPEPLFEDASFEVTG